MSDWVVAVTGECPLSARSAHPSTGGLEAGSSESPPRSERQTTSSPSLGMSAVGRFGHRLAALDPARLGCRDADNHTRLVPTRPTDARWRARGRFRADAGFRRFRLSGCLGIAGVAALQSRDRGLLREGCTRARQVACAFWLDGRARATRCDLRLAAPEDGVPVR